MAVIGIYTKDFPDLGRSVLNTDIIPITEIGNVVTYKTTIADLMNSRITGSEGQLSKFGAGNTLTNSILKEIGNAIHLTNGGSSYAAFGIVNPGTPGAPGVDNDAYIGSTINNDFLIRVNNTEALRVDTALRLKIANIQNAITDTDKFLVSDGGVVKYRTASEMISDLGIDLSGYVTLNTTQTITGIKSFTQDVSIRNGSGLYLNNTTNTNSTGLYTQGDGTNNIYIQIVQPKSGTIALTSDIHDAVTIGTANGLSLSGQVLSLGLASSINAGALSATDYLAFSNKQNALTVSSPLSISTGPTPNIAIQVATSSQNGYLSSTDWNTFNNKQNAGSYVTTDTTQTITGQKTFSAQILGSISGTSTSISNTGTVTLASPTEQNGITITQPSYISNEPVKLLNFTWYNNLWSLGNIRGVGTGSNGLGVFYTPNGGSRVEVARYTSTGNMLIGTTTDAGYKLDVNGTLRATGAATFSSSVTAKNGVFQNPGSSPNNTLFIQTSDYVLSSAGSVLRLGHVATTGNTTAIIQNLTSGGTASGNISFLEGNVGIGTTSPAEKLTVAGNIFSNAGNGEGFKLNGGLSIYRLAGDDLGFYSASTERMRITSGGNVLIGTTTDNGAKLQVNGSVLATAYFESSSVLGKDILTTNPITELNLDVIKYTRKSDENKDVRYGYSAEQVHALMPELTDKDVASVKYLDVHTILIAQLQQEIKELKAKLN